MAGLVRTSIKEDTEDPRGGGSSRAPLRLLVCSRHTCSRVCFGQLTAGFRMCPLFHYLCFSAPQEGGSGARVSLAPRATVDKRKKSWARRAPRVTGVSVGPEKLSWGPVYAQ